MTAVTGCGGDDGDAQSTPSDDTAGATDEVAGTAPADQPSDGEGSACPAVEEVAAIMDPVIDDDLPLVSVETTTIYDCAYLTEGDDPGFTNHVSVRFSRGAAFS